MPLDPKNNIVTFIYVGAVGICMVFPNDDPRLITCDYIS